MQAGKLRHKIVIEKRDTGQGPTGQQVSTWATFATVRGSLFAISSREALSGDARFAEVTHRVRARYIAGITPAMCLTFDSRTFDIKSAENVGQLNRELVLMVRERLDA